MSSLGWGLDPYGLGPYGSAEAVTGLSIANAVAIATNEVQVTLTREPAHVQSFNAGDALNPATWNVQRLDNGFMFHVMSVRVGDLNTVFILTVLEPFGSHLVAHRVSSTTLEEPGGALITPPTQADFQGVLSETKATVTAQAVLRRAVVQDIANPQARIEGGTLVVGTNGDYQTEAGVALLRKLLLRRLMTTPGDFFHLPNYGVGIKEKEPLIVSDLVQLKARIETQMKAEPEVEDASCALELASNGMLNIKVRVRVRETGQEIPIEHSVPTGGQVVL